MPNPTAQTRTFFGSAVLLASATAASQAVVLLAYPALARVYTPDDLGVLGAFEALLGVLLSISTLRYHSAIPLPADGSTARELARISAASVAAFSVAIAAILAVGGATIAQVLHPAMTAAQLSFLPLAVLCSGLYLVFHGWQLREKHFREIARARVLQGTAQAGTQLLGGLIAPAPLGLLIGLVVGRATAAAALACTSGLSLRADDPRPHALARYVRTAWQYRRMPLWSSWSAILNTVGSQLSVLAISARSSAAVTGWYSLSFSLVMGPAYILCQSVENAFAARVRETAGIDRIGELAEEVFVALVVVTVAPACVLSATAPLLFGLLFGPAWTQSGVFASALAPTAVAALIGAHLPILVVVRHWQRQEFLFNVTLAATRIAALLLGEAAGGPTAAIVSYGLVSALLLLGYAIGLLVAAGGAVRGLGYAVGRESLLGAALSLPIVIARYRGQDAIEIAVALACVSVIAGIQWRRIRAWRHDNPSMGYR